MQSLRCFLAFPSSFQVISMGSISSMIEAVLVVSGDCEDRSKNLCLKDYSIISKSSVVSWKGGSNI